MYDRVALSYYGDTAGGAAAPPVEKHLAHAGGVQACSARHVARGSRFGALFAPASPAACRHHLARRAVGTLSAGSYLFLLFVKPLAEVHSLTRGPMPTRPPPLPLGLSTMQTQTIRSPTSFGRSWGRRQAKRQAKRHGKQCSADCPSCVLLPWPVLAPQFNPPGPPIRPRQPVHASSGPSALWKICGRCSPRATTLCRQLTVLSACVACPHPLRCAPPHLPSVSGGQRLQNGRHAGCPPAGT